MVQSSTYYNCFILLYTNFPANLGLHHLCKLKLNIEEIYYLQVLALMKVISTHFISLYSVFLNGGYFIFYILPSKTSKTQSGRQISPQKATLKGKR